MTFPAAPTNNQHYVDPITKNLYIFDETNREWINVSKRGTLNTTGYVPTMTSNSQDGFTISGSSRFNSTTYDYYKAFDGNNSTAWASASTTSNLYITVNFPKPEVVWQIYISSRETSGGEGYIKWAVQYYDDNLSDFVDWNHQRFDLNAGFYKYFSNSITQVASDQWRLYAWQGDAPNPGIRTAQFYVKTI
jgi:inner membrane protein involved in colicin E2 resistance